MRPFLLIALLLVGCAPDHGAPETVQCQIDNVAGTFVTTTRELRWDTDLVRMWRDERLFMWPRERINFCTETEGEWK